MLPPGGGPHPAAPAEILTPKKQAVVDRLRRRIEGYRRHQADALTRHSHSSNGFCEANMAETLALKQKFLESKSKRGQKKQEKKTAEPSLIAQHKFLKRPAEDDGDYGEAGGKVSCGARSGEDVNISVKIDYHMEFTTSAANPQPPQISTNVTVKTLTNTSLKSEAGSPASGSPAPHSTLQSPPVTLQSPPTALHSPLLQCKQEPDSEFVDLEQCAAALEKDAQHHTSFPGFSELIGHEGSDEMITSDAFKDLISEISDINPEFMKDFDFGENSRIEVDSKEGIVPHLGSRMSYDLGLGPGKAELSPAAQTLKQMAEQHQHKQLNLGFPARRSPYTEYHSQAGQAEVKQEVLFNVSQSQSMQAGVRSPGSKTPTGMMGGYKQQFSPYSSPGGHGSPGFMPRAPPTAPQGATLHMNQAQQMHINQQPSAQVQVSSGQHMQSNGDIKPNISIAAQQQQGLYFSPSSEASYTMSQSQTINFTQQSLRQRPPPEQMMRTPPQRPPPPDYKSPQQPPLMHSMAQQRFPAAGMRRPGPGQQPMPPSGPMMRPQMTTYMSTAGLGRNGPPSYFPRPRPPNVNVGPEGLPLGPNRTGPEWRHVVMSQNQSASFAPHMRSFSSHPGNMQMPGNPGVEQLHPQMRNQLPLVLQSNSNPNQMGLHMSQSQSISIGGVMTNSTPYHMHHPFSNLPPDGGGGQMNNGMDLGLELLENLTSEHHDLFGGLDSPSNFNFDMI